MLTEGLINLEDLDAPAFIELLRNLHTMQATEKLDGTSLWLGVDGDKIYTCRPNGKPASRFYAADDYPYLSSNNGLRSAHAALQQKEREIRTVLNDGEQVELQIIFGRQPNAVAYGLDDHNYIVITDGAGETSDVKAAQLSALLNNQQVSVKTTTVESPDGKNLDRKITTQSFRFTELKPLKTDKLKDSKLNKILDDLEKFLKSSSSVKGLSNQELLSTSLTSIPQEQREAAKTARAAVVAEIETRFKKVAKKEILTSLISSLKSSLSAAELHDDEDIGVEGIVVKDPVSGSKVKILDTEVFSTVNDFNFALRNRISGSIRTIDPSATIEARGGLIGLMRIRIAELMGNPELALSRVAKEVFAANAGSTTTDTIKNVAAILNGSDYNGTKTKIDAIIDATLAELASLLETFTATHADPEKSYKLKLKNGKTIGLSDSVVKRTLVAFAEAKRNLEELKTNVKNADSFAQLVSVLYGRAAKDLHSEELTEALLEKAPSIELKRYAEVPDVWSLINIYIGVLLASIVIYKAQDKRGMHYVRDKHHHRLTAWSSEMSQLNFWGYVVWHSKQAKVAKLLKSDVAKQMAKIASKVPAQWVRFLHMELSFGEHLPIDWHAHQKTIDWFIQHSKGPINDRLLSLIKDGFAYDTLSYDEKVKYLPKLYFFVQQYVPTTTLRLRLIRIQEKLLAGGDESEVVMAPKQKLLGEDGEIAVDVGSASEAPMTTTSALTAATTAQNIANVQSKIGRHANIVRRRRNPEVNKKRFARPTKEEQ